MAEHTKTPWEIDQVSSLLTVIRDWQGNKLAVMNDLDSKELANAHFIVQAVNSHDKLVEALEQIASCEQRASGDVVSIARQALKDTEGK